MSRVDFGSAEGSIYGAEKIIPGQTSISAGSWNAIVRATNAGRTVAAQGSPSMSGPYGNIIGVPKRRSASGAFPFQIKIRKTGDDFLASVSPGSLDGVISADFDPTSVSDGAVVYATADYESAYDDTPTGVTISVAASPGVLPKSHDTRWVVALGSIETTPSGALKPVQLIVGGQTSRRLRQPRSFDVTREGAQLRVHAGHFTALTNPSDTQTVNQPVASALMAPMSGTLRIAIEVTSGAPDGEAPFTFTVHGYSFEPVDNTNQGLFMPVPAVEIPSAVTTTPDAPKIWATGTLDPSAQNPSCFFVMPIADVVVSGDEWKITQRQCGDIQIPLNILWGIPLTPAGTPP